jgi:DsbC/DsbD-like thiol-disulfide interchange protein
LHTGNAIARGDDLVFLRRELISMPGRFDFSFRRLTGYNRWRRKPPKRKVSSMQNSVRQSARLLFCALIFCALILILPINFYAITAPQSAPNIGVNGKLSADKVKRGGTVRGTVTMDIPSGYHVNSSRPLEKFLVATQLTIEAANGVRVGPVAYPRALLRNFQFSKTKVSVYEGRAVMNFNVNVPARATTGSVELKGRLRYQSCNDSVCFPPKTQEVSLWLTVN